MTNLKIKSRLTIREVKENLKSPQYFLDIDYLIHYKGCQKGHENRGTIRISETQYNELKGYLEDTAKERPGALMVAEGSLEVKTIHF